MELLFVYGSLKRGEPGHAILLKAKAKFIGEAETTDKFIVRELNGYPIAIPSSEGDKVKGELYEVEDLALIDDYEDAPYLYERVKVEVVCEGKRYKAWMYMAKRA